MNGTGTDFEAIANAFHNLPVDKKAKLIQEELKGSGLSVVFGSNSTTADICIQINNARDLDIESLLTAVTSKMKD